MGGADYNEEDKEEMEEIANDYRQSEEYSFFNSNFGIALERAIIKAERDDKTSTVIGTGSKLFSSATVRPFLGCIQVVLYPKSRE